MYVWIPPGSFRMGCSAGDKECYDTEKPAHAVTITKEFWIGQTEVTQSAYKRVTGSYPSQSEVKRKQEAAKTAAEPPRDPSGPPPPPPPPPRPDFRGQWLPAESMTWEEARAYCSAVGMRLPTEAEWEYAARGGKATARDGPPDTIAWHWDNSEGTTHNVAQKKPNGYGLYDMVGNVEEWVADWFDEKSYASSPATDPKGPPSGEDRTVRGGSWLVAAQSVRVTFRYGQAPGDGDYSVGFRCAGDQLPGRP
jgi:formylglycine-generating enzyme required for sulfatase activity